MREILNLFLDVLGILVSKVGPTHANKSFNALHMKVLTLILLL